MDQSDIKNRVYVTNDGNNVNVPSEQMNVTSCDIKDQQGAAA